MVLRLEDKKVIIAEVAGVAQGASSAVAVEYRGLTVEEMTKLRVSARKSGVYLKVVRNTLARRALDGTDFSCMKEALVGPLLLAFSKDDPGSAARVMRDFAKEHEKLVVKVLAVDGQLLAAKDINVLANLPTYDQALAMLISVMQAPVVKFARTLKETHAKLARTLLALQQQKESSV